MTSSLPTLAPGATPHTRGVHFRVWAPNATRVYVAGEFTRWKKSRKAEMRREADGYWSVDLAGVRPGDEYRFLLETPWGERWRNDPYARQVQHSNGNSVVYDPAGFDWGSPPDAFVLPPWNQLVVYEMHIGTFHVTEPGRPGTFESAVEKLPYVAELGVNAIEVMPPAEFPGDYSWGYNPAHPFAIETAYGGPDAFKYFVKSCHERGIAVLLDVVYNHFGPSDLDLWQFDGWHENDGGGIYFYNDWRARTPWGNTRPDYGRPEVRRYIRDNALMWLEEYRVDGLRFDMTPYIRSVDASEDPGNQLADGFSLLRDINHEIRARFPGRLVIAEDMHGQDFITDREHGAGFGAQWDSRFVHPVREALITTFDEQRDLNRLIDALRHRYNGDAFRRVIYTESHDEVANGRARVPEDIAPGAADSWHATKRSTLGAAMVLTAPGIPMMFQGQTLHEDGWFADTDPLDWSKEERFRGINHLYADLIALRLNRRNLTPGLGGQHIAILTADHGAKLLAYCRWDGTDDPTAADCTVVVLNFSSRMLTDYTIALPREGQWFVHFNSDWDGYNDQFSNHLPYDPVAAATHDGMITARIAVAPYTALLLSQVADGPK